MGSPLSFTSIEACIESERVKSVPTAKRKNNPNVYRYTQPASRHQLLAENVFYEGVSNRHFETQNTHPPTPARRRSRCTYEEATTGVAPPHRPQNTEREGKQKGEGGGRGGGALTSCMAVVIATNISRKRFVAAHL